MNAFFNINGFVAILAAVVTLTFALDPACHNDACGGLPYYSSLGGMIFSLLSLLFFFYAMRKESSIVTWFGILLGVVTFVASVYVYSIVL